MRFALTLVAVALSFVRGCFPDSQVETARRELTRVTIPGDWALVHEGTEQLSAVRHYVAPHMAQPRRVTVPSGYRRLPALESNTAILSWRTVGTWVGTGYEGGACFLYLKVSTNLNRTYVKLTQAQEIEIRGGKADLLRLSAICEDE